ncbi:hypothetical protein BSW63_22905 [Salmonella enterica subsp. enterica serovar Enteritidis]|nr:hypothetical protein [Salmonella enterica subsp. enterica serovar Enteritidis]ELC7077842.1 hypothetical protein [Salmonella enterica]
MEGHYTHTIFIVTNCNYMQAGLVTLMSSAQFPVSVRRISKPEDVLIKLDPEARSLILVPMFRRNPKVQARAELFLWKKELLQHKGVIPQIPCLILGDCWKHGYQVISEYLTMERIQKKLSEILAHPETAMSNRPLKKTSYRLSPLQEEILSGMREGKTVAEIAEKLNVSSGCVFSGRASLISKLGLKNRLGLMSLTTESMFT